MKNNQAIRAFIFYLLIILILFNFGNFVRKLSYNSFFDNYSNPLFSICHVTNTGSAFGLFTNNSHILAIFGIFALVFLTYYVYKNLTFKNMIELVSISVFASGTLGNITERFKFNHVIDYIKLNFIDFPVFNIFDVMICIGVFLYFISVIVDLRKDYGNSDK